MDALNLSRVLRNRDRGLLTVQLVRFDDATGEDVVVEYEACGGWKAALEYARHLRWLNNMGRSRVRTSVHSDDSLHIEVRS